MLKRSLAVAAALFAIAPTSANAGPATPIRSWTPTGTGWTFKKSAVCHDNYRDEYVIAAVFQGTGPAPYYFRSESVYLLRVRGNSASGDYGQLIGTPTLLRNEWRIDHVDCASDDDRNVFVTFDRYGSQAVWYRVDGATISAPYTVVGNQCQSGNNTHKPRIAYGNGRVMLAFEGHNYSNSPETDSCEICTRQFNATTGAPYGVVPDSDVWNDNMTHTEYDLEWNGIDKFIMAAAYSPDGAADRHVGAFAFTTGNVRTDFNVETFAETSPDYPSNLRLVFSNNARNSTSPKKMFVQTNTTSYWLTTSGAPSGTKLANAVGTRFAACEYWGAENRLATMLSPTNVLRYVGTYPTGYFVFDPYTRRAHYGLSSAASVETSNVNAAYLPDACDNANTDTDPELFVTSTTSSSTANVYWNILPND